jgi:tRNA A-37 threonylcarbamoyl transferase component Bud32
MPPKKTIRRKPKLWIPEQVYRGSSSMVFIHPEEIKSFRKGAKKVSLEIEDPAYLRMVKRTPFFFKEMPKKGFTIMKYVSFNGLPTEEVVYYRNNEMLARNRGTALQFMAQKPLSQQAQKKVIQGMIDYFSKLHSLGVEHHHPGSNNIVFHNGRISVIDFKYASINRKLDWSNPETVFRFFKSDYRNLLGVLNEAKIAVISKSDFIEELVSGYTKMTAENKHKLTEMIKAENKI